MDEMRLQNDTSIQSPPSLSVKECECACIHLFVRVCTFRSAPVLTSPTCDIQRGSDPLTPAGTHTPLVLIDSGFMLAGQTQNGNRKKKRRRGEKKTEKKKINIKQRIIQKNSIHVALLPVNNKQFWLGKKEASQGFNPASNAFVNVATSVRSWRREHLEEVKVASGENNESRRSITGPRC